MQMAREEREEFAALLEELTPEQWESPTLCERWRVREVVAHAVSYDELTRLGLVSGFARGFLQTDRINAISAPRGDGGFEPSGESGLVNSV